jgi:hypothetical protein
MGGMTLMLLGLKRHCAVRIGFPAGDDKTGLRTADALELFTLHYRFRPERVSRLSLPIRSTNRTRTIGSYLRIHTSKTCAMYPAIPACKLIQII